MSELNSKKLRLAELLLVLLIPMLPSVANSIYILANHLYYNSSGGGSSNYDVLMHCVKQLSAIALMLYVLYRQGRKIEDIGLSFHWLDLLRGAGIYAVAHLVHYELSKGIYHSFPHADLKAYNVSYGTAAFGVSFLFMFINPFYEELIVRAYAMTDIEFLSGSKTAAVIISALFQTSYHLYQGLVPALLLFPVFLIYSLYFARYKKIMPVIIAHVIADMIAMIYHYH